MDTEEDNRYILWIERESDVMYIRRLKNASIEEMYSKPTLISYGGESEKSFMIRSVLNGCEPSMRLVIGYNGIIESLSEIEDGEYNDIYRPMRNHSI